MRLTRAIPAAVALAIALTGCARKHIRPGVRAATARVTEFPETGIASWYGYPYHGRAAANGEIYDMETMTAAHRTLPFNTWVRVTNLGNGKTTEVRIIDRGPFIEGRVIDLSKAAARQIDLIGPGTARVRVEVISTPVSAPVVEAFAVQVGAFQDRARAEKLRAAMEAEYGTATLAMRRGTVPMWRVLVGREPTEAGAENLLIRLRQQTGQGVVVRLDGAAAAEAPHAGAGL